MIAWLREFVRSPDDEVPFRRRRFEGRYRILRNLVVRGAKKTFTAPSAGLVPGVTLAGWPQAKPRPEIPNARITAKHLRIIVFLDSRI